MADKSLFIDIPWTSQPQGAVEIDWANPLSRGLIATNIPHIGEIVSKIPASISSGTILRPCKEGVALGVSVGTNGRPGNMYTPRRVLSAKTDFVLVNWDRIYAYDSPYGNGSDGIGMNNNPWIIQWTAHGTNWNTNVLLFRGTTPISLYTGKTTSIVATWNKDINGGVGKVLINNIPCTYSSGGLTTVSDRTQPTASTTFGVGGDVNSRGTLLTIHWDRDLSATEIKSLSDNPWQIFKPRRVPINFAPRQPWSMRESRMRGITDLVTNSSGIDVPRYTPPSLDSETSEASRVVTVPRYVRSTQPQVFNAPSGMIEDVVFPYNRNIRGSASFNFEWSGNYSRVMREGYIGGRLVANPGAATIVYNVAQTKRSRFTAIFIVDLLTNPGAQTHIIGSVSYNYGIYGGASLVCNASSLGVMVADATTNYVAYADTAYTLSKIYVCVITVDNNGDPSNSVTKLFINGRLGATLLSPFKGITSQYSVSFGGGRLDMLGGTANVGIYGAIWLNQPVTDDIATKLSNNPWQIFKSNNTPIFGGGNTQ